MFNATTPSLADIAAVTDGRGDDGFGGNNGWWILIILFALFAGWGNGGGFGGGNNAATQNSFTQADIQRGFDNQSVMNKLNGLENGVSSLGYDQLNQMNGINQNVNQTGYGIHNAIQQVAMENVQNTNSLQSQISNCCCENREATAQVRYDMATNTCRIENAINNVGRDIIENANCNYRSLHDEMVAMQMAAKDEKIAEQQAMIQSLNLTASQCAQNQYLINQLRPAAVPAFSVPNPYSSYGYGCYSSNCCSAA